jgi:hypothetical protein
VANTISTAFIAEYQDDVHQVFQRSGGFLRPTVRMKPNVVGSTTTFQKIGKGVATTKARNGLVTPMNPTHTAPSATLVDFYAPEYVDKLDEAKTNIDERLAVATAGASALGRKVDNQIITLLDGTSQTQQTITVTSKAAIHAGMLTWTKALWGNDVSPDGNVYGIMTPTLWAMCELLDQFSNSNWVGAEGQVYKDGPPVGVNAFKKWLGVNWTMHTDCPGIDGASCKGFIWHKNAIGYATGKHAGNSAENDAVKAEINYVPERVAHLVNHMMSGGGVLVDDTGVIEATWDDSASIPTS